MYVHMNSRDALVKKDHTQLADLMKENFSTRRYLKVIILADVINISYIIVLEKFMVIMLLEKTILE